MSAITNFDSNMNPLLLQHLIHNRIFHFDKAYVSGLIIHSNNSCWIKKKINWGTMMSVYQVVPTSTSTNITSSDFHYKFQIECEFIHLLNMGILLGIFIHIKQSVMGSVIRRRQIANWRCFEKNSHFSMLLIVMKLKTTTCSKIRKWKQLIKIIT